jgi:hypothetical protein
MAAKTLALICLSALLLTASETMTPAQSLNSSSALIIPEQAETPISPATPGTGPGALTNETTGTNALTGLPCSGEGALATSGAGALADTESPPPGSTEPTDQGQLAEPGLTSVFGPTSSLGAC